MTDTSTRQLASALLSYLQKSGKGKLPSSFIKDLENKLSGSTRSPEAIFTSAVALSAESRKLVESYVKLKLGNLPQIKYLLDPSLIAGFTVKTGDYLLDASLSTKLDLLQTQLRYT